MLPKLFWPTVRKNCSSDGEKKMKFEAEDQEFAKILRSLEHFVWTLKVRTIFGNRMLFLTCSWRFLISNKLELKLKKKYLDLETWQEKLEIVFCCNNCLDLSWQKVSQFLKKGPQVRGQRLIICDLSYLDTVPSQENQVTK